MTRTAYQQMCRGRKTAFTGSKTDLSFLAPRLLRQRTAPARVAARECGTDILLPNLWFRPSWNTSAAARGLLVLV